MKQFYISNDIIDKQINEIKQKIRLSMNGVVSDSMKNSGIIYYKNFGVSIPRLKEIAQEYTPNHDLAQRLWLLKIRETMILATLLQPADKFNIEGASNWISEINNSELVEQSCMNLFSKLKFAHQICTKSINSDQIWDKVVGFVLAARIYKTLDNNDIQYIIQKAFENIKSEEFNIFKSIALCMGRFCRIDIETQTLITQKINEYCVDGTLGQNYIAEEIRNEILFLSN